MVNVLEVVGRVATGFARHVPSSDGSQRTHFAALAAASLGTRVNATPKAAAAAAKPFSVCIACDPNFPACWQFDGCGNYYGACQGYFQNCWNAGNATACDCYCGNSACFCLFY